MPRAVPRAVPRALPPATPPGLRLPCDRGSPASLDVPLFSCRLRVTSYPPTRPVVSVPGPTAPRACARGVTGLRSTSRPAPLDPAAGGCTAQAARAPCTSPASRRPPWASPRGGATADGLSPAFPFPRGRRPARVEFRAWVACPLHCHRRVAGVAVPRVVAPGSRPPVSSGPVRRSPGGARTFLSIPVGAARARAVCGRLCPGSSGASSPLLPNR